MGEEPRQTRARHRRHRLRRRLGNERLDHGLSVRRVSPERSGRAGDGGGQCRHRRALLRCPVHDPRECPVVRVHRGLERARERYPGTPEAALVSGDAGWQPGVVADSVGIRDGAARVRGCGARGCRDHRPRRSRGCSFGCVDDPRQGDHDGLDRCDRRVGPQEQASRQRLRRVAGRVDGHRRGVAHRIADRQHDRESGDRDPSRRDRVLPHRAKFDDPDGRGRLDRSRRLRLASHKGGRRPRRRRRVDRIPGPQPGCDVLGLDHSSGHAQGSPGRTRWRVRRLCWSPTRHVDRPGPRPAERGGARRSAFPR